MKTRIGVYLPLPLLLTVYITTPNAFVIKEDGQSASEISEILNNDDSSIELTTPVSKQTLENVTPYISVEEIDVFSNLIDDILDAYPNEPEDTAEGSVQDPLATFCQTAECVKQLQDYMKWRQENGYPAAGGRWG